jgi:hypothetical protein
MRFVIVLGWMGVEPQKIVQLRQYTAGMPHNCASFLSRLQVVNLNSSALHITSSRVGANYEKSSPVHIARYMGR